MKGKYLITTDAWFYAPDGRQYKSVWGDVNIVSDDILGIKTNIRSSNWFAKIGSETNHVLYRTDCTCKIITHTYDYENEKHNEVLRDKDKIIESLEREVKKLNAIIKKNL